MLIGISGKIGSGKDTIGSIIQYLTSPEYKDGWNNYNNWLEAIYNPTFNSNWEIKKFADTLKDIVCLLINCTREQLEDETFKNTELGEEWWKYSVKFYNNRNIEDIKYLESYEEAVNFYKIYVNDLWLEDGDNIDSFINIVKLTPRLLLQLLGTECGRNIIHPNIWINSLFSEYKPVTGMHGFNPLDHDLSKGVYNALVESMYPNWIITDMRFPNEMQAVKDRNGITIRINRPGLIESNHLSETSLDSATFDFIINNDKDIEHLINEVKKILEKLNII